MTRFRCSLVAGVVLAVAVAASLGATRASAGKNDKVVVQSGESVQLAVTFPSEDVLDQYRVGVVNAVRMAVAMHPTIRGFPIELSKFSTPCFSSDVGVANAIIANTQYTAVVGNLCSNGLELQLPVYETAGVVAVSGSATRDSLPALAPTVFNRTIVSDGPSGEGEAWLAQIEALPSVLAWNQYGNPPVSHSDPDFDALHFDAAMLVLDRMQQVSKIKDGNLVIDRKEFAKAVRKTAEFPGVTCTITLDPKTGNRSNDQASLARCGG